MTPRLQMGKAPTTLLRLRELAADTSQDDEVIDWLMYTYNLLTARKAYHKKQQVKKRMLLKVAGELLSDSEMEEIERQAQIQAEPPEGVDEDTPEGIEETT